MRVVSKEFRAVFHPTIRLWEIESTSLHIWIKHLRIKEGGEFTAPKNKYQIIIAENVEFELQDSWLVLISYWGLKKAHLWDLYDPDKPRNLAKTVTVK